MSRYTDVDALLNALPNEPYKGTLRRILMQAPTADVAPVVHGRWTHIYKGTGVCSICHRTDGIDKFATHCRYCGAKMDG